MTTRRFAFASPAFCLDPGPPAARPNIQISWRLCVGACPDLQISRGSYVGVAGLPAAADPLRL